MQTPDYIENSANSATKGELMVKQEYESELNRIRKEFVNKLSEIDKIHKQQIETERNVILNSWRWRIGNFQVNIVVGIKDLIISFFRFATGKKYRINTNLQKSQGVANESLAPYHNNNDPEPKPGQATLACIFDVFTHSCFQPEFNIISPFPDNWKHILKHHKIDALFCESAWKGNNASWRFYFGKIGDLKKKGLPEMLDFCRQKNIPTLFWNKEDPVHFDHFIDDAKHFDYIFTSDASIIPEYRKRISHNRIFPLPFAAQEKIHNPIQTEPRNGSVCFAGTWYAAKYAERILDMEVILNPAKEFGLEIYDRNFGSTGYEKVMYGFPEAYQPFIKGKLEYNEMVGAYKRYKVFLNINSVRYSPTMFSRRVFELLACGTPVISTYSEGILNLLGENTVLFTESENDTRQHLEKLLNDKTFWWKQSLNGIRKVLENHTYHHRVREMFEKTGLPVPEEAPVTFYAIGKISDTDDALYLSSQLKKQVFKPAGVLLISDVESPGEYGSISEAFAPLNVSVIANDEESLAKHFSELPTSCYCAVFKKQDYYGENYLRDLALAVKYSDAQAIGKRSHFMAAVSPGVALKNQEAVFQYVDELLPGSVVIKKKLMNAGEFADLLNNDCLPANVERKLAIDPWNYIQHGRFAGDEIQLKCEL